MNDRAEILRRINTAGCVAKVCVAGRCVASRCVAARCVARGCVAEGCVAGECCCSHCSPLLNFDTLIKTLSGRINIR